MAVKLIHAAFDVVLTEREWLLIYPEQVKNRRMNVRHGELVLACGAADFVRGDVTVALRHAHPGEEARNGRGVR